LASNGAIKQAARAGLGVSFVSRDAVAAELDAQLLDVIAVESAPAPRAWHVMRSAAGPRLPVVEDFLEFVRSPAGGALSLGAPPYPSRNWSTAVGVEADAAP
jgi:DNA-binding transcriptional LysR family regulator